MHTYFCDGKDSPEEMVLSAIEKGLSVVGICTHSYLDYDLSYCIPRSRIPDYLKTVSRLKTKYKDKIRVLCGIEQDMNSPLPTKDYDYVIGSLHDVDTIDGKVPVDMSEEVFVRCAKQYFGGDFYAMAESYFEEVAKVCEVTRCNIIGHFDLISKYNENGKYFDENHPRYVKAYTKALDRLLEANVPFEINTGAMSRGCKSTVYPNKKMRDYILSKGGKCILSSDSHCKENIAFRFDEMRKLVPEESLVFAPDILL